MGLRDEVDALKPRSKMDEVFAALNHDEMSELNDVLNDPLVSSGAIGQVLRRRGYDINDRTIQRHRQMIKEKRDAQR